MLKPNARQVLRPVAVQTLRAGKRRGDAIPLDQPRQTVFRAKKREFARSAKDTVGVAARELPLPADGATLHAISRANYRLFDVVGATLAQVPEAVIESLHIATLSFNAFTTAALQQFLDAGRVQSTLLLCASVYKRNQPETFEQMREMLTSRGHRLVIARTHAKVLAMKLSDGRFFSVEGSGNLRSCSALENLAFTQSRQLYEFHVEWIEAVASRGNSK